MVRVFGNVGDEAFGIGAWRKLRGYTTSDHKNDTDGQKHDGLSPTTSTVRDGTVNAFQIADPTAS